MRFGPYLSSAITRIIGGSILRATAASVVCYFVLRLLLWLSGRQDVDEARTFFQAVLSLTAIIGFFGILGGLLFYPSENRIVLYFGKLCRLPKGGGFRRMVKLRVAAERFEEDLRQLIGERYRVQSTSEPLSPRNGFRCRVTLRTLFQFDVEVRPEHAQLWSISVRRHDWYVVGGIVEAGAAQLLGALLLLAEKRGLIEYDFEQGVSREQILKDLEGLPCD